MKVELVKETLIDGTVRYSVEMDGVYVSGSVTRHEGEARAIYERALKFQAPTREVLEATEVES